MRSEFDAYTELSRPRRVARESDDMETARGVVFAVAIGALMYLAAMLLWGIV